MPAVVMHMPALVVYTPALVVQHATPAVQHDGPTNLTSTVGGKLSPWDKQQFLACSCSCSLAFWEDIGPSAYCTG